MRPHKVRRSALTEAQLPLAKAHYLTVAETAELYGKSTWWVRDQIEARLLPALRVGSQVRVEAEAVIRGAPCAIPRLQAHRIRLSWAAQHWRVSVSTLRRMAADGRSPFERRPPQGHWGCTRVAFREWVMDHTTGDQAVEGGAQ